MNLGTLTLAAAIFLTTNAQAAQHPFGSGPATAAQIGYVLNLMNAALGMPTHRFASASEAELYGVAEKIAKRIQGAMTTLGYSKGQTFRNMEAMLNATLEKKFGQSTDMYKMHHAKGTGASPAPLRSVLVGLLRTYNQLSKEQVVCADYNSDYRSGCEQQRKQPKPQTRQAPKQRRR